MYGLRVAHTLIARHHGFAISQHPVQHFPTQTKAFVAAICSNFMEGGWNFFYEDWWLNTGNVPLVKANGTRCHVFCMPLNGSLPTSSRVTAVGFEPTPLRKGGQGKNKPFENYSRDLPEAPSFYDNVVCAKHFLQIFHGRWNFLKSAWKFATKLQQED